MFSGRSLSPTGQQKQIQGRRWGTPRPRETYWRTCAETRSSSACGAVNPARSKKVVFAGMPGPDPPSSKRTMPPARAFMSLIAPAFGFPAAGGARPAPFGRLLGTPRAGRFREPAAFRLPLRSGAEARRCDRAAYRDHRLHPDGVDG